MRIVCLLAALLLVQKIYSQDSLDNILDKEVSAQQALKPAKVFATFKGTHLINSRTNETIKKNEIDFRVSHRFGDIAGEYGGENSFFGLENSTDIKISFDYGITNRLTAGISRAKGATAIRQLYEGSLKYKLLEQTANNKMPVSVTAFTNAVVSSMASNTKANTPDHFDQFSDRMSYTGQLIIARKFSDRFSLMLIPTFVHTNYVIASDQNDVWAVGVGGRLKITKRMSLIVDYYKTFRGSNSIAQFKTKGLKFYNPLGIGLEFETGGHVFDFNFTNSTALLENQFIPYTTTSWLSGQFRWGFNISRIFSFKKNK
ncbi:DUF5777 family beta-barrel protein [Flavihumibacter fluvii]|uniref:DUF5777 family beta-barrel protein n=1 Tax=Flavihumibacter fluvii TaxID=2838157 RepID=UPI001BDE8BAB|nr:DUF5777 family beta-barrel protein [Flavihumibacter fluvii]ULQ51069.1 DUF5777 family beta-barrel protein [Flavihumibacter fluvii]